MERRQFLLGIGSLLALPAFAAQRRLPHVALFSTSPDVDGLEKFYVGPFLDQMRQEFGWTDKVNIRYERVYNEDRLRVPLNEPVMRKKAAELVAKKPDVVWVDSSISAKVVMDHTSDIPVVGSAVSYEVYQEWVEHRRRPGKNFTAVSNPDPGGMAAKRLQLLVDLMPKLKRVGLLAVPDNRNSAREWKAVSEFGAQKGIAVTRATMSREDEVEAAFAPLRQEAVEAVIVAHHPVFQNHRKRVLELARQQNIPLVGTRTYYVRDGALMSYSTALDRQMRRSALHVHKILKGEAASDIPIDEFREEGELAISCKTAQAFGLTIPKNVQALKPLLIDC